MVVGFSVKVALVLVVVEVVVLSPTRNWTGLLTAPECS